MATYASRPAWDLGARAARSARVVVPLGLGLLVAVSLALRTTQLGIGYWIDEGLSVGIADRPLTDIPGALRVDGSPPLYYMLLHFWIRAIDGGEQTTHALSLLFALLCIPVAWWSGRVLMGAARGVDRGRAGGAQPVADAVRAGDAHVLARRAGDLGRDARASCALSRSRAAARASPCRAAGWSGSPSRSPRSCTRTTGRCSSPAPAA